MSARPGRVKTKQRNLKQRASARPALGRSRRRRKPAALAKKLDSLAHMFNAELCEQPAFPPDMHRIHFTRQQLDKHAQTCFDACAALLKD